MGKSAFEVQRRYAEAGVSIPVEDDKALDYNALELDFVGFLEEKEASPGENRSGIMH